MFRRLILAVAVFAAWCPCSPLWAQHGGLLTEPEAARHGLVRPWITQMGFDSARGRLCDLILYEGTLYAQTDRATIHAIDAETGKMLWSKQVGRPNHPSLTPSASHDFLAVVNGSRLYVVNRLNGDLLYEREVEGAPGAGAALSAKRAYVPMVDGMVVAYRLEPEVNAKVESAKAKEEVATDEAPQSEADRRQETRLRQEATPPLFCRSYGRALVQPLVTRETAEEEYVTWPTDRGYLNVGHINRVEEKYLELKYRLATEAPIVTRPAYLPPDPTVVGDLGLILAVSRDGFAYAIRQKDGVLLWRFSAGEPIVEAPALIDDRLYVATQLAGMYCLDIAAGKDLWWAPGALRFVAASQTRVYVVDRLGRLLVLNAQNGARLDSIAAENIPIKFFNTDTDRIYLAESTGLIECLHEVEQREPLVHGKDRKQALEEKPAEEQAKAAPAAAAEKPAKKAGQKKEPAAAKEPRPKKGGKKAAEGEGADAAPNP